MFQKKQNRTRKKRNGGIHGKIISRKEGWITAHIWGDPYTRGYAHGCILYKELELLVQSFESIVHTNFNHISLSQYIDVCVKEIKPAVLNDFPEFYEELRGISEGAFHMGVIITIDSLIAWNAVLSMDTYFKNNEKGKHNETLEKKETLENDSRCSAFIATGNATHDGKIVMAHNTHCHFMEAKLQNIILYITPSQGSSFVMQCSPGFIASGTDWFLSKTGIIGCETTISEINYNLSFGTPYFCRIRQAIQYGKTLDDYVDIMLKKNAGDYACSWLFGNIHTNEIMLFELGLKKHAVRRTKDGVYYGMNSAIDFELRTTETNDKTLFDLTTSSGARNARFNQLLNNEYYGKINLQNAQCILSDHYDSLLKKTVMNSRSICKHVELTVRKNKKKSYYPFGCVDGKVVDSTLAKKLAFIGRFGSSCGRVFRVQSYVRKHTQYKKWQNDLADFSKTDWTLLQK
jgi:hypothetical protein